MAQNENSGLEMIASGAKTLGGGVKRLYSALPPAGKGVLVGGAALIPFDLGLSLVIGGAVYGVERYRERS